MRTFSISIDIDASPEQVWAVMSDIERWHEWTASVSSVRKIDPGILAVGTRARIRQPKLPPSFWRVTALEPNRGLTWISKGPGVRVTARHAIEPAGRGSRVTLSIEYDGLLSPLLVWLTRNVNDPYLAMEATGLKERSEALEAAR